MAPKGPYKLCTVNTAPDRAKRLIGRIAADVKEDYTIDYVENCESMSVLAIRVYVSSSIHLCMFPFIGGEWNQKLIRITGLEDVKSMCERNKPDVLVRFFSAQVLPFVSSKLEMSSLMKGVRKKYELTIKQSSAPRCGPKRKVMRSKE